jgi:hypothetical protein
VAYPLAQVLPNRRVVAGLVTVAADGHRPPAKKPASKKAAKNKPAGKKRRR